MKTPILSILLVMVSLFAMADDYETVTIGGHAVNKQATVITFSSDDLTLTYSDGSTQTSPMQQVNIAFKHEANLSDASSFDNLNTIKTFGDTHVDVHVTRTLRASQWGVICLPFDLGASAIATIFGSGARVASLQSISGTTAHFATCEEMSAGTPYIICPAKEVQEFVVEDVFLHNLAEGATVSGDGYDLRGAIATASPSGTVDYIANGNKLKALATDGSIRPLHGYFSSSSSTPTHLTAFAVDGEVTGSMSLLTGDVNDDKIVNITDVMMTVNSIIGQEANGFNMVAADLNGDGLVTITDVLMIVNILIGMSNSDEDAYGTGSDIATNPSNLWDN